jgi:pimeloyl-ACP methyl ester carboxylesterase
MKRTIAMTSAPFENAKRAKVNGTTLAYCEQGEGDPVLFVHGGVSDLRIWANQLPAVGRFYRAISYSRRYARPNEDIDLDAADPWLQHVDDLAVFLREIGASPAHLVGNSQGAFISLLAAIRYPELVRSLVLEEPPVLPLFVSFPPRAWELLRTFATRPRTAIAIAQFVLGTVMPSTRAFERGEDEKALEIFLLGVLGRRTFAQLPKESVERSRENVRTLRAGFIHNVGFPPLTDDDVRGVRVPVLLVTGDRSPAVLLRLTDRLEELLPIVEHVEIPDASHIMHEENAPRVNQAICGFLGGQRGDST